MLAPYNVKYVAEKPHCQPAARICLLYINCFIDNSNPPGRTHNGGFYAQGLLRTIILRCGWFVARTAGRPYRPVQPGWAGLECTPAAERTDFFESPLRHPEGLSHR